MDNCQLGGFGCADQRALGHQRLSDTPGNRGVDRRVVQIDLCRLRCGLGRGQVGFGLLLGGDQGGVFLLAHRIGFHQRLVALHLGAGLGQIGLALGDAGLGAVQRGAVNGRVNLVQLLPGTDLATLMEQAFQNHPIDPCTHLRHPHRTHTAWQFGLQRHGFIGDGHHADGGRRLAGWSPRGARRWGRIFGTAGHQQGCGSNGNGQQGPAAHRARGG